MCGFIQREPKSTGLQEVFSEAGLTETLPLFAAENENVINFYPAFGKDPSRKISNLIVSPQTSIDATWWFDAKPHGDSLLLGDRTTFNARNLDSPFWKHAIQSRRAIVAATAVGESNPIGKGKAHYLMKARRGLLIGAVYRIFDNGCAVCSVITRPPQPGFSQFHEKSIPCFLPTDPQVIDAGLSGEPNDPLVNELLANPRLYDDLCVTPVKSFKSAEAKGPDIWLHASAQ